MHRSRRAAKRAARLRHGPRCLALFVVLPGAARGDGQTSVFIDLGTTKGENGMTCPSTGDGDNTPVAIGGVDCRRNLEGPDYYMYFNVCGLVSGWTPSHGQIGQSVTFEAKAVNAAGDDTESWQVIVKAKGDLDFDGDCDQADFGLFQACLSGDGAAHPAGCEDADLNGSNDVSAADVETFLGCLSGPDIPVEARCAD